jgi:hypothetical protein
MMAATNLEKLSHGMLDLQDKAQMTITEELQDFSVYLKPPVQAVLVGVRG